MHSKLSTVVTGDEDYQHSMVSNDPNETISAKIYVKSEPLAYSTQKTVKIRASAGNYPKSVGIKEPESEKSDAQIYLHRAKKVQAAELYSN